MKKVIELLESARESIRLAVSCGLLSRFPATDYINEALAELKAVPRWHTPKQWKQRTGEPWPENAAVRILNPDGEWELMEYWRAKQLEQDLARLDKDFGDEPEDLLIVCDRGEAGPPPKDWRPE
jgi:hypothetical protein